MTEEKTTRTVTAIMSEFARATGLSPVSRHPRRYLWTDAFAVCNFLELFHRTGEEGLRDLALCLVDQVHDTLGRHREDDPRKGWISGLTEKEGKLHPTAGGLRIGKKLNERRLKDALDEELEWDQDGQYFHYLTKWMHALNRVTAVTGDFRYNRWAMELAKTAHARFTYMPPRSRVRRMYWKMSIDLSYPLVPSMGHHDPLDGFITYNQLEAMRAKDQDRSATTDLEAEIDDMWAICEGKEWATDDPLGLGGLLSDALRVYQLVVGGSFRQTDLVGILLDASLSGMASFARQSHLARPAEYRLPFREFGLTIGLGAGERLSQLFEGDQGLFDDVDALSVLIEALSHYLPLRERIETFWLEPKNQGSRTWIEHRDINMVMLATSLAPDGYLIL
jgi:hypothetical protein